LSLDPFIKWTQFIVAKCAYFVDSSKKSPTKASLQCTDHKEFSEGMADVLKILGEQSHQDFNSHFTNHINKVTDCSDLHATISTINKSFPHNDKGSDSTIKIWPRSN
jgi:hypothetical protein